MDKLIKKQKPKPSRAFKKSYVALMIVWSILTMGAYIGVWFIQRHKDIERMEGNHHVAFGLWKVFTVLSFVFLFIQLFGGMILSDVGISTIDSLDMMFSFFFVGLLYYSIFRVREVLEENTELDFNPFALFFLHIFYIQYKANKNLAPTN
jgi:hypothetical protein